MIEGGASPVQRGQPTPGPAGRASTVLEADADTRQGINSGLAGPAPGPPASLAPPLQVDVGPVARPFRPTARPPLATLTVYDDGKADGESIRLRDHRFVIGRTEGDLRIPIDGRISARHAEITLQAVGGRYRWVVTDLQSTHGMFVRVSRSALADRAEFLVGGGRYRFDPPPAAAPGETLDHAPEAGGHGQTRGWDDGPGPFRPPALAEMIGNEVGNRILLVKPEYWIGTDPACPISRADDPFCEPKHARLYRGPGGGWHVEHDRTPNGLWLRMAQVTADAIVYFQLGEQRFRLRVQTS